MFLFNWTGIKRVDVSIDDGKHFTESHLYKPVEQKRRCEWGWTQFHHEIPLSDDVRERLAKGEKVSCLFYPTRA